MVWVCSFYIIVGILVVMSPNIDIHNWAVVWMPGILIGIMIILVLLQKFTKFGVWIERKLK